MYKRCYFVTMILKTSSKPHIGAAVPRKWISYCTGQKIGTNALFVSCWKKYLPYWRNPAISTSKCIPDRNKKKKKKKKKKNVLTLSSLHSPASVVVSETHSAWPVLPQTPDLLDRLSPSPFLIYFLFSLSSFFFLLFGCVQFIPNNLNLNFFKHLIKLIACKCDV